MCLQSIDGSLQRAPHAPARHRRTTGSPNARYSQGITGRKKKKQREDNKVSARNKKKERRDARGRSKPSLRYQIKESKRREKRKEASRPKDISEEGKGRGGMHAPRILFIRPHSKRSLQGMPVLARPSAPASRWQFNKLLAARVPPTGLYSGAREKKRVSGPFRPTKRRTDIGTLTT